MKPMTERTERSYLEAFAGHGLLFCSSKQRSPLCQTHFGAEKGRSLGIRKGRSLISQGGVFQGQQSESQMRDEMHSITSRRLDVLPNSPPALPTPTYAYWPLKRQEAKLESQAVAWSSEDEIGAL